MESEGSETEEKRESEPVSMKNRRRRRMARRVLSHHVPRPSYGNGSNAPRSIEWSSNELSAFSRVEYCSYRRGRILRHSD